MSTQSVNSVEGHVGFGRTPEIPSIIGHLPSALGVRDVSDNVSYFVA